MQKIDTFRFSGMRPGTSDHLLEAQNAKYAKNIRTQDGCLRGMKDCAEVKPADDTVCSIFLPPSDAKGICQDIKCFDEWTFAAYPPTVDMEYNQLLVLRPNTRHPYGGAHLTRCLLSTGEECPAYLPPPMTVPQVKVTASKGPAENNRGPLDRTPDPTEFFYTWVDKLGVESGPSPMSLLIPCFYDGSTVEVSSFDRPPQSAECMRVYRYIASQLEGAQQNPASVPPYILVAEVPVTPGTAVPTTTIDLCGQDALCAYDSLSIPLPPPADMCGLTYTNRGHAVGWAGKFLYVAERNCDYSWPMQNRYCLEHVIKNVVSSNGVLYIGTTGPAYRAFTAVDAEGVTTVDIQKLEENYPLHMPYSMVATNFGAMYATDRGLVALQANGGARLISKDRLGDCDWGTYAPNLAAWVDTRYVGFRAGLPYGFVFDVQENAEGPLELGDFYLHDIDAKAAHTGHDGVLYVVRQDGSVCAWTKGTTTRPYLWRSKTHVTASDVYFTAGRIDGDFGEPVTLRLYACGQKVFEMQVSSKKKFRLPPLCRAQEWCFELEGSTKINRVELATSFRALAGGKQ